MRTPRQICAFHATCLRCLKYEQVWPFYLERSRFTKMVNTSTRLFPYVYLTMSQGLAITQIYSYSETFINITPIYLSGRGTRFTSESFKPKKIVLSYSQTLDHHSLSALSQNVKVASINQIMSQVHGHKLLVPVINIAIFSNIFNVV